MQRIPRALVVVLALLFALAAPQIQAHAKSKPSAKLSAPKDRNKQGKGRQARANKSQTAKRELKGKNREKAMKRLLASRSLSRKQQAALDGMSAKEQKAMAKKLARKARTASATPKKDRLAGEKQRKSRVAAKDKGQKVRKASKGARDERARQRIAMAADEASETEASDVPVDSTPERGRRTKLSVDEREAVAVATMTRRLENVRGFDGTWRVNAPELQTAGDDENPITGTGLFEVQATRLYNSQPRGVLGRIWRAVNPGNERAFFMYVDKFGNTSAIEGRSNTPLARAARAFSERIPVREIVRDIMQSSQAKGGLTLGAVGVVSATGNPAIGAVAIMSGVTMISNGLNERAEARNTALSQTVTDLRTRLGSGENLTFAESYRVYQKTLDNVRRGTTPLSPHKFFKQLSAVGL